jgi:hypothetical protein
MRQRRLFIGALVVDGILLVILVICLTLGIFVANQEPTVTQSEVEPTTVDPTPSRTVRPSPTPSTTPTLTPTQTWTPTPLPTMALVTPLPTLAIEEPTKLPYVFPSPIRLEGSAPPTPTRTGPR